MEETEKDKGQGKGISQLSGVSALAQAGKTSLFSVKA